MARYTGPKNRLMRRESVDLGMKTVGSHAHAELLKRLNIIPGQHGVRGKRKVSDYGVQLREKQKVKRMYGMMERQFRKIFEKAKKYKGNTGEQLIQFLERRLDNTVYRMALAPTRACARQQISHRHVLVDGNIVTIPSYEIKADQVIISNNLQKKLNAEPSTKFGLNYLQSIYNYYSKNEFETSEKDGSFVCILPLLSIHS